MANDPSAVSPGDSTYSLRTPDSVSAAAIPQSSMDRVLPRQTSTGLARGVQQLGSPNVYVDSGNEQIIVAKNSDANTSTPQVLMGNQATFGEGFYVTKPGIDATAATNSSDFIFNSNQDIFKIVQTGTITVPDTTAGPAAASNFASSFNTVSVVHNLGFAPVIVAYWTTISSDVFQPVPFSGFDGSGTAATWTAVNIEVTSTNIIATATSMVYGNTTNSLSGILIKYFLLQESVSS